jgi:hypothetical protein
LLNHSVEQIPPFAILSHRWVDDEASYRDYVKRRVMNGIGFQKIIDFFNFAKSQPEAHKWAWVDSIDKRSSSELTEAIVTGLARDIPILYLPVGWQVSRELASPANSVLNLICSSSSYVLVIEPVCRLSVVDYIRSCLHLHLRPDPRS